MDPLRPPPPDELRRFERMVRRGVTWLFGGLLLLGTATIIYPGREIAFAIVGAAWVAVIVTRFAFAKNEFGQTHRSSN